VPGRSPVLTPGPWDPPYSPTTWSSWRIGPRGRSGAIPVHELAAASGLAPTRSPPYGQSNRGSPLNITTCWRGSAYPGSISQPRTLAVIRRRAGAVIRPAGLSPPCRFRGPFAFTHRARVPGLPNSRHSPSRNKARLPGSFLFCAGTHVVSGVRYALSPNPPREMLGPVGVHAITPVGPGLPEIVWIVGGWLPDRPLTTPLAQPYHHRRSDPFANLSKGGA